MCLLLIQAAILFLPFAIASILSAPPAASSTLPQDITTVAGTTGCFENPDDGLVLVLDIDSAEEECTTTAPRLNGLPLVSSNHGNGVVSGQVFLKSKAASDSSVRDVHASWESTCLNGEASIISIRVEGIVGQGPLNESSGFTTSFKQKGQPKVLRLQDKPVSQLSQDICNDWLASIDQELAITPALSDSESHLDLLLQAEYSKLAQLQTDMEVMHERIHSTLGNIMSLLKQKFTSCSSMKCVWNTAVNEVSPIANLFASHFKHHKNLINKELVTGCREGDAQSPCSVDIPNEIKEDEISSDIENDELDGGHITQDALPSPTPAASIAQPTPSTKPTTRALASSSSPTNYVQVASSSSSAPSVVPSTTSPHALPHTRPHDEQVALQRKLSLAIIILVLLVILCGVIIRAIIKYRHPRRRAERAAAWEERRNQRLYRKAACKHKWRTFWKNLCSWKQAAADYEEKRHTILEDEGLLDDDGSGLHKEIRTMRNASEFVRDIVVEAEEGRARVVVSSHRCADGFEPAELNGGVGSSRSSDIAPSYKTDATPPPQYEEHLEGEMIVVDGFRYTYSSASTTDLSSESSIVDCSPRLSLETGRSTIVTKDTRD
ncbi:hypothetical protein H2200_002749 [Cladophialophora chaetospira]|uniref:Uncharacterized protein n=1 Tax=Cladophialophora chaetospira TaxID=386627 RepID=A0AA38XJG8_9EURO|nr:hypothetical protein H2200_002749 [Cladophialophora chaetospira]